MGAWTDRLKDQAVSRGDGAVPHSGVVDTAEDVGMKTALDGVIDTIPPVADGPAYHTASKADGT